MCVHRSRDTCSDLSCSTRGFMSGTSAPRQYEVSGQCLLSFAWHITDERCDSDITPVSRPRCIIRWTYWISSAIWEGCQDIFWTSPAIMFTSLTMHISFFIFLNWRKSYASHLPFVIVFFKGALRSFWKEMLKIFTDYRRNKLPLKDNTVTCCSYLADPATFVSSTSILTNCDYDLFSQRYCF